MERNDMRRGCFLAAAAFTMMAVGCTPQDAAPAPVPETSVSDQSDPESDDTAGETQGEDPALPPA